MCFTAWEWKGQKIRDKPFKANTTTTTHNNNHLSFMQLATC